MQLGDLGSHFDLEAQSRTGDDHVPDDFTAKGFVARFNIGQINTGEAVGQEREPLIWEVMVEVREPGGLAYEETGSVNRVRASIQMGAITSFISVILQVGVLNNHDAAGGKGEGGLQASDLPLTARFTALAFGDLGHFIGNCGGLIG